MQKFDSLKHGKLTKDMPFSYISTAVYLDFCAYILNINDEELVVTQDSVYKHDYPSLFLPKKKINWEFMSTSMLFMEDIKQIENHGIEIATQNETETEFIYSTQNFLNPSGNYKTKINQFVKEYAHNSSDKYDTEKITKFHSQWAKQKSTSDNFFTKESNDFFFFCLKNLDKYNIQQVYIEVDGELAGFVWGVEHSKNKWINLHIKCDYTYRGLSRFLNYEIAKKFSNTKLVSFGTGCQNPGLIKYKKELGPIEERQYHYVLTRKKK